MGPASSPSASWMLGLATTWRSTSRRGWPNSHAPEELTREVGDVQSLPFADAGFDCVIASWMLYHVPDLDLGVSEIARVLRAGGCT